MKWVEPLQLPITLSLCAALTLSVLATVGLGQLYDHGHQSIASYFGIALLLLVPCLGIALGLNRILRIHHEGIKRILLVLIVFPALLLALLFALGGPADMGANTNAEFLSLAGLLFISTFMISVSVGCMVVAPIVSALAWIADGFLDGRKY